jgi:hypothetical protein
MLPELSLHRRQALVLLPSLQVATDSSVSFRQTSPFAYSLLFLRTLTLTYF